MAQKYFLPKMAMMKICASFPPWDGRPCIALIAAHTNQKLFQCERPREKRAVLRERKEALGSPVKKWIMSKEGVGSINNCEGRPCLSHKSPRSWRSSEYSGRREMTEEGKRIRSRKYPGAWPICEPDQSMWEPWVESEQWVVANENDQTWRQRCAIYEEIGQSI